MNLRDLPLPLLLLLAACSTSGARSGKADGADSEVVAEGERQGQRQESPSPSAALDGTWDITSLTHLLLEGKTGQMTVAGGKVTVEMPMDASQGNWDIVSDTCELAEHRQLITLEVSGSSMRGEAIGESKYRGTCDGVAAGTWRRESVPKPFTAKRIGGETSSIYGGRWVLSDPSTSEHEILIDVKGLSFKVTFDGKTTLSGGVEGANAKATADDVVFAARRR